MSDLIERVVAARKAAEAEHSNPDGSARTEAQAAAILIAQVNAILEPQPAATVSVTGGSGTAPEAKS